MLLGVSVLALPLSSFLYRLALVSSESFGKLSHRCFYAFSFSFPTKQLLSIFFSAGCRSEEPGLYAGFSDPGCPLSALWPRERDLCLLGLVCFSVLKA